MSKQRLGKGLKALLVNQDATNIREEREIKEVTLSQIEPNPYQPRQDFNQQRLEELSASIKEHGLLQPITLTAKDDETYYLISGERRWRAAKLAGLDQIAAVICDCNQQQMMELALIENLQREDLDPIEEASAYQKLMAEFDLTQAAVAERVGKSRSTVANSLRLLNLASSVQKYVSRETLAVGHARALLALESTAKQEEVAEQVIANQLSVRETEKLVKSLTTAVGSKSQQQQSRKRDANLVAIEDKLRRRLGAEVSLQQYKDKGQIVIKYYSDEELSRLLEELEV